MGKKCDFFTISLEALFSEKARTCWLEHFNSPTAMKKRPELSLCTDLMETREGTSTADDSEGA